jgi:hypothetical protein
MKPELDSFIVALNQGSLLDPGLDRNESLSAWKSKFSRVEFSWAGLMNDSETGSRQFCFISCQHMCRILNAYSSYFSSGLFMLADCSLSREQIQLVSMLQSVRFSSDLLKQESCLQDNLCHERLDIYSVVYVTMYCGCSARWRVLLIGCLFEFASLRILAIPAFVGPVLSSAIAGENSLKYMSMQYTQKRVMWSIREKWWDDLIQVLRRWLRGWGT